MAHGDPGLAGAVWGIGVAVAGLVLATDYRGAAHWIAFRRPTVFGVRGVRCLGAVFAVAGPAVLVTSTPALTGVGTGSGIGIGDWIRSPLSVPWPFLVFACGIGSAALRVLWWSPGPFRRMWDAGGRPCRAALVVHAAAFPALLASLGFANKAALLACATVGFVAAVTALLTRRPPD
ncbi:hypothetical protein [Streptomyces sp. NPDC002104]